MIKRRGFSKIFPGWWIVLTGGFIYLWEGGFHGYGFSAFFKPIASELGFSRAVTSVAPTIKSVEGMFALPLTGWITDKFGPRWPVLAGVFLMGLGLVVMNFVNSLWAFYVVWGVILGTGFNIGMPVTIDTTIANWFVKKRGRAIGTRWVISGFSGILVALVAWLIINIGWRMTLVIGGVVMWLVGLPLVWFFFKPRRPEYYGLLPDGATTEEESAEPGRMIERGVEYAAEVEEVEFTLRQTVRTRSFRLLTVAVALQRMATPAITLHGIPFLTDRGIDPLVAASILAMMIFVGIPFRLVGGLLADRTSRNQIRFLIVGSYGIQAISFAIFLLNQQSIAMIYVWFVLYGIGHGFIMPLEPLVRGRYFGRKAFGSIQGISTMLITPVMIAAPIYAGWVYDTTGSYITAFIVAAAALAFATVFMSLATPPKPPAKVTDIRKIV